MNKLNKRSLVKLMPKDQLEKWITENRKFRLFSKEWTKIFSKFENLEMVE